MTVKEVKSGVNRSTFGCPLCQAHNLDRASLVEHVNSKHSHKSAVCPICITYPYGDPNYVSQNLAAHLQLRHKYDMEEVI